MKWENNIMNKKGKKGSGRWGDEMGEQGFMNTQRIGESVGGEEPLLVFCLNSELVQFLYVVSFALLSSSHLLLLFSSALSVHLVFVVFPRLASYFLILPSLHRLSFFLLIVLLLQLCSVSALFSFLPISSSLPSHPSSSLSCSALR